MNLKVGDKFNRLAREMPAPPRHYPEHRCRRHLAAGEKASGQLCGIPRKDPRKHLLSGSRKVRSIQGEASLWPAGVQGKAMPLAGCTAWHEFIKYSLDQEGLVS